MTQLYAIIQPIRRLGIQVWLFWCLGSLSACTQSTSISAKENAAVSIVKHPEWSVHANIYEVNLRQYTPGGTFAEFENHLPRLQEMGVRILWFMPIHPIGEVNRKGRLGSYYSVKDYRAVNPEFGTLEEFKALVEKIHSLDMYVLIDWVANHTALDNPLAVQHPDWYTKDEQENFVPPVPDWSDVIDLNYDNQELREYMIDVMKFWVQDTDIDGFRCDVAGMVPTDFWNEVRVELDRIKPVFLLAEWETPELHEQAFDMTYSWELYRLMNSIAKGEKSAAHIDAQLKKEASEYPASAYRMIFTSNHDENSWNGTVYERLGKAANTFAVLAGTLPGMPLIYSGQEAGLNKRLAFFEKDLIEWRKHDLADLYQKLLHLKTKNRALWNGEQGGAVQRIRTSNDEAVLAFVREKEGHKVLVILNLTDQEQAVTLSSAQLAGAYQDVFAEQPRTFEAQTSLNLQPWAYLVYAK